MKEVRNYSVGFYLQIKNIKNHKPINKLSILGWDLEGVKV